MGKTTAQLDEIDRRLLDAAQVAVPLERRAFRALAQQVDIGEAECLSRVQRLRHEQGVIRQISAIFDTRGLGYESSLVGSQVEPERIEEAAAVISGHPGVSHNYQREHALNLWFTLAVGPESKLGLGGTVDLLKQLSGADQMLLLPTLRLYKIGVRFDLSSRGSGRPGSAPRYDESKASKARSYGVDEGQKQLIRVLQQDLPITEEPFSAWADQAGCEVADLLAGARKLQERSQMRRFSAVLRHREVGMQANVMVVWTAAESRVDEVGRVLAEFEEVSHCYRRPTYPDWPYNLYTMVHAKSRDQASEVLARMSAAAAIPVGQTLWSGREFKKQRVKYFTGDAEQWELIHAGP